MSEMNQNYSEEPKKKKGLAIALILCLVLLFIGIAAAFFSSVLFRTGNIQSGTLELSGSYTFYLNGTETALSAINNLYPGDVVVVKGTISNTGTQSAWVRDEIHVTAPELAQYIEIYSGEYTQDQLTGATPLPDEAVLADFAIPFANGIASSPTRVINGVGTNAAAESAGDYNYLNSTQYSVTFTIYFQHTAGNDAQGKTVNFTVGSKALQFVNNNAAVPLEDAWTAIEFVTP